MDKNCVNENLYFNPRFTKKSGEVIMYNNENEIIDRIVKDIAKNPRFPKPNFNSVLAEIIPRSTNG